jgi:DNA-binding transcriptional MerR regulator
VITIGQLARYAGVSTKTIRVYHDNGLLLEPSRDSSGYRRYTAQHAIDLIKIRTLAEAGVPLARIQDLKAASGEQSRRTLHQVDIDLTARIRKLRHTQRRLRQLAAGQIQVLPPEVTSHLERLHEIGFSPRWAAMEADLWILVFATHPYTAIELFHDQAQALTDQALRQVYLDYDRAHDPKTHRHTTSPQRRDSRSNAATDHGHRQGGVPRRGTHRSFGPALIKDGGG